MDNTKIEQILEKQNNKILDAIKTVEYSQQIGIDILNNLNKNNEQIKNIHKNVHDFSGIIDNGKRKIQTMKNKENCIIS